MVFHAVELLKWFRRPCQRAAADLALEPTANSLRCAALRCGFRQQVSVGVRPQLKTESVAALRSVSRRGPRVG